MTRDDLPDDAPHASDAEAAPRAKRRGRPELSPQQRALGLLVRREHSRKELARKLTARGVEPDAARDAVDRMTAEGWQDDDRFAEQLIRSRAANGYGPLHIRAELGTHGIDRERVQAAMEAFEEAEGDWSALAVELVQRRFGGRLADRAIQRKAAELLARRGFTADQARRASRYDPDDA